MRAGGCGPAAEHWPRPWIQPQHCQTKMQLVSSVEPQWAQLHPEALLSEGGLPEAASGLPGRRAGRPPVHCVAIPTAGHLQMNPRAVLDATLQVPPFLQGLPLHPLMTDSQRRPGDERTMRVSPAPCPWPHPLAPAAPPHATPGPQTYQCGRGGTRSGSR